jgi:RNA polymerase sigma factor (sigma-70 family)
LPIHTAQADFYSQKVISGIVALPISVRLSPLRVVFSLRGWNKTGATAVLLDKWQRTCTGFAVLQYDPSKVAMVLSLKAEYGSETEDFESDPKIVKFAVVKRREEDHAKKEDITSFEAVMLPHLDAAHNLAKWLLRNEQDAQDVVQEAYLRAFKSFGGFHGSNGRAWLLTIVRNTSYTLLKKNRVVDLTTTFDEEIHAAGHESVSPATILEHSEDAELIREAMDELPAEFREILALRHQEGLSYKEIADIAQIPPGTVMSRLARARAKLKECLAARIGKER